MHLISEACRIGRVDLFVQSTDKNFLVPIGGAVVCGPDNGLVESVGKLYPGMWSLVRFILLIGAVLTSRGNDEGGRACRLSWICLLPCFRWAR